MDPRTPRRRLTAPSPGRLASVVSGVLFALGCEDKPEPPPAPPPAPAASDLGVLGVDGSILGDTADPPAPAGDLKSDLDRFVNIETCVSERAKLDPLVGDALGALGYDTFLRDACRLLEAAKDKRRESCDRIDSSALRARCQSWVAMIALTPDACPLQFDGALSRGRAPMCVAVAARDPRLCAGEPRSIQRATCDALVARDPAKCETLLVHQRGACQREVARWRGVLAPPLEGFDKLPSPRGKLGVHGVTGTPDPPETDTDLTADFARGVVVVTGRGASPARQRMRVELGTVAESEARRIAAGPQKRPRVGLALLLEGKSDDRGSKDKEPLQATLQKLELEMPGALPLVSPPASCDCKLTVRASPQRGAEVSVSLEGTLASSGVRYQIALDVVTFVRDVVADQPDARTLPPIHPALPERGAAGRAMRADGGR